MIRSRAISSEPPQDAGQASRDEPTGDRPLVGTSAVMRELRARIARIAAVDSSVLLRGETGTGKGLIARILHRQSRRSREPFVHVDCATLCATLAESELFGHERGAFTGAALQRRGRCELAGGGVLFLDEVGDIDPALQSKLLRLLQDRCFERLGGAQTLHLRARVIAATNRDLERAAEAREFRRDLYYRLKVVEIELPPLRARCEDIPALVAAALADCTRRLGIAAPEIDASFLARLREHAWPGNVRELLNLVERCLVERPCPRLEARHLDGMLDDEPCDGSRAGVPAHRPGEMARVGADAERIAAALRETGGNVSRAARRLGIARSTLRYRIARHGLGPLIPSD